MSLRLTLERDVLLPLELDALHLAVGDRQLGIKLLKIRLGPIFGVGGSDSSVLAWPLSVI